MLSEKKVANLADAFKLLELKAQEALQVKFYILNPTGKKNSRAVARDKTHGLWGDSSPGADGSQLLIPLFCAVDPQEVQDRINQCCHLP